MKYLIVGSGGREHAIAWRLLSEGSAREVFVAPGNGGIEEKYRVPIEVDDFEGIYNFCRENEIDMVVVGPEVPLVLGLVDYLEEKNIPAFGPKKDAAMIEGSKLFAKRIMETYGVPTAKHEEFVDELSLRRFIELNDNFPLVIKLDGLAAGKGVGIVHDKEEAHIFVNENVEPGTKIRVLVEEFLKGEEASVFGISDGETVLPMIAAQDHKRIFDGDKGPNTGGMGAYAPAPVATPAKIEFIKNKVLQPVIDGMRKEGIPFKGILYAGVMIDGDDIKVLEFNARFGDPETQVVLPLLETKLGTLIQASVKGGLDKVDLKFKDDHAMTVVMSSQGYPGSYEKGKEINGLNNLSEKVRVFHAGTSEVKGKLVTNGGRVLNVTSIGSSLQEAAQNIYDEIDRIQFDGAFYRKDIGHRAL
ncbi:phosphoribosylamine--glycine ligase [candidate division KSB3 bacterium]|uniref:Phosphoribosylamine--glycine ligase n=1 Tax=candidate division KSB3 bacterium TaxID=2044937 RepID=A0A2G6E0B0_9BACT|nr:MAG: phosphoribosylamine--glycine ligase [candidate division KSB3 bacterium]